MNKKVSKSAHKMKAIMQKAWAIAREGSSRFGGSARQYMSEAMKEAWKTVKGDMWIDAVSSLMADLKNTPKKPPRYYGYTRWGSCRSMEGGAHWMGR